MHHKFLMIPVVLASLAGLAAVHASAQAQEATSSARIRVFKEAAIDLYPGEYCYGSDSSAAIHASDGEVSIFSFNIKEGMPLTEDTPSDYNEYVIEAGKPFAVRLQFDAEKDGLRASCGPLGSYFIPQAGKNYDVSLGFAGSCFVRIRELYETSPGRAEARLVPASHSFACQTK